MNKKYDVAILGATGAVGEAMLSILEQRNFPVGKLFPLASSRSAGSTVTFRNQEITVQDVEGFDFSQVQIGLFSAGSSVSEKYAPIAAAAGLPAGPEPLPQDFKSVKTGAKARGPSWWEPGSRRPR